MKYLINLSIFFIFSLNLFSQSVYVSPNGDDNNDGSIHSPFKTISVALSSLNSDTIILLNGVYREKINLLVDSIPDMCIGADVIVGFPGESELEFASITNFIKALPISYLHVFSYS